MLLSLFLLLMAQDVAPATVAAPDLPAAIQLAQEGRNAEALAALQKIAAANPNDHLTRLWIANVHARMGHPQLAEAVYHSIVLEDPRNVDAWVGLGTVLLQEDRVSEGLDALKRAEQLAPDNPGVVAALASGYRLAGDDTQSVSYYQRLAAIAPTVPNQLSLERARRDNRHRFESQTFGEHYSHTAPKTPMTRGQDLAVNLRVSDSFRVIGRGQIESKFSNLYRREQRYGGGVEWRWTPWGTFTGQVLAGPNDNRVLPQRDYMGRVDYGYHRATYSATVRYFDFLGANVTMLSPALTVAFTPRWTATARYALTSTDTTNVTGVRSHTVDLRLAHEIARRVWLRGDYIRGIENFDQFSIDHINEFRAKAAGGGIEIRFPTLTSLVGNYDYQWRDGGIHMGRVNVVLVQAF